MSMSIEPKETGSIRHDIGCVVVLFNPDNSVVSNIDSYKSLFGTIMLIDNSTINNELLFANFDSHVNYVPLYENTGIAHALNVGLDILEQRGYKYAITMDQDSSFETSLSGYHRFIDERGMRGVLALSPQYRTDRESPKNCIGWKKVILTMQSGCLFSLEALDQIGGFCEELFIDVVDWECFLRGHRLGLDVIQCNEVVLLHNPAITKCLNLGPIIIRYGIASPERYYYQIRNLTWTFLKYKYPHLLLNTVVKWSKIVFLFPSKKTYISYAAKGVRDGMTSRLGPIKH